MKFISLFAGIGGLDLGLERAGMECVAQVEIDDFCQKVLTKHWADVQKFKDVRDVGKHNLPPADVICGGFPCQDVSLAGKQLGLGGKRSTLWSEFYRIVCEIRPKWVVIENVRALLSSDNGQFFTKILWELSSIGYDAEWRIVSASDVGAPHERERLFIIAYPNKVDGEKGLGDKFIGTQKILRESPEKRTDVWVQAPVGINRMDDGVPSWFYENAVGGYGNAVVPQVAEFIGRCIMENIT